MYWAGFPGRMLSRENPPINPVLCKDSRKVNEWMNEGMKTKTLKLSQSHTALLSPFGKNYKFLINFLSLDILIQNKIIHQV